MENERIETLDKCLEIASTELNRDRVIPLNAIARAIIEEVIDKMLDFRNEITNEVDK